MAKKAVFVFANEYFIPDHPRLLLKSGSSVFAGVFVEYPDFGCD